MIYLAMRIFYLLLRHLKFHGTQGFPKIDLRLLHKLLEYLSKQLVLSIASPTRIIYWKLWSITLVILV